MFTQRISKLHTTARERVAGFPPRHKGAFYGPDGLESGFARHVYISLIALCLVAAALGSFAFLRRGTDAHPAPPILSAAEIQALSDKAEHGDAPAQRTLGALFAKGQNIKQDYHEAATWYQRAAAQNDALAECALGELFEAGRGVAQDDAQAGQLVPPRRRARSGSSAIQSRSLVHRG